MRRVVWGLLWGVAALGCASPDMRSQIEQHFVDDYHCSGAVVTEGGTPDDLIANGCGYTEMYQCHTESGWSERTRTCQVVDDRAAPRALPPRPRARTAVQLEDRGKQQVLLAEITLEGALVRLTAVPDQQANVMQLKLIQRAGYEEKADCNLALMLDDQVMKTPPSITERSGGAVAYRVHYGAELIEALASAGSISLRACGRSWRLSPRGVRTVHDFIDRSRQEAAWKAAK